MFSTWLALSSLSVRALVASRRFLRALPVPALPGARGSPLAAASPQGPHVSPSPVPEPCLLPALCPVLLKPELWPGQVFMHLVQALHGRCIPSSTTPLVQDRTLEVGWG